MTEDYQPTNREKSKQPRGHSGWCDSCDRELVNDGEKCPYCGQRNGRNRFKFNRRNATAPQ